jgi:hypothetical protein
VSAIRPRKFLSEHASSTRFVVDLAGPGITRTTLSTVDPTRSHARLALDGAPAEPLGAAGAGSALWGASPSAGAGRDHASKRVATGTSKPGSTSSPGSWSVP